MKYIPSPVANEVIALVSLFVIMAGLLSKPILENKIMNYLGKISYGIYVIHPLLLYVGTTLFRETLSRYEGSQIQGGVCFAVFIGVSGLTIALAALSYKYYEKPFLRMKDKFAVVHSTNESMR